MKIVLIGHFPEPIGGVSIHLSRLSNHLEKKNYIIKIDESSKIKNDIFNIRSLNIFRYISILKNCDICHIQSGLTWIRIVHIFFSKIILKKITIVTVHSFRGKSKFTKFINRFFLQKVDFRIYVNESIKEDLEVNNFSYKILEAFLPPLLSEEREIPDILKELIQKKKRKGYKIIISNAWKLVMYNNEDLYGLDLLIDVCILMKRRGMRYFFIFNVCTLDSNNRLFENYQKKISENGISEMFYLININDLSFVKLMEKTDCVVRATNTDGDSITIRESLYFRVPIIASDCIERPEGTILFKNRDIDDLFKKITNFNFNDFQKGININNINNFLSYERIYTKLGRTR